MGDKWGSVSLSRRPASFDVEEESRRTWRVLSGLSLLKLAVAVDSENYIPPVLTNLTLRHAAPKPWDICDYDVDASGLSPDVRLHLHGWLSSKATSLFSAHTPIGALAS